MISWQLDGDPRHTTFTWRNYKEIGALPPVKDHLSSAVSFLRLGPLKPWQISMLPATPNPIQMLGLLFYLNFYFISGLFTALQGG